MPKSSSIVLRIDGNYTALAPEAEAIHNLYHELFYMMTENPTENPDEYWRRVDTLFRHPKFELDVELVGFSGHKTTPILYAISSDNPEIVRKIINCLLRLKVEGRYDVTSETAGLSVLTAAIQKGNKQIFSYILSLGIDANSFGDGGPMVLYCVQFITAAAVIDGGIVIESEPGVPVRSEQDQRDLKRQLTNWYLHGKSYPSKKPTTLWDGNLFMLEHLLKGGGDSEIPGNFGVSAKGLLEESSSFKKRAEEGHFHSICGKVTYVSSDENSLTLDVDIVSRRCDIRSIRVVYDVRAARKLMQEAAEKRLTASGVATSHALARVERQLVEAKVVMEEAKARADSASAATARLAAGLAEATMKVDDTASLARATAEAAAAAIQREKERAERKIEIERIKAHPSSKEFFDFLYHALLNKCTAYKVNASREVERRKEKMGDKAVAVTKAAIGVVSSTAAAIAGAAAQAGADYYYDSGYDRADARIGDPREYSEVFTLQVSKRLMGTLVVLNCKPAKLLAEKIVILAHNTLVSGKDSFSNRRDDVDALIAVFERDYATDSDLSTLIRTLIREQERENALEREAKARAEAIAAKRAPAKSPAVVQVGASVSIAGSTASATRPATGSTTATASLVAAAPAVPASVRPATSAAAAAPAVPQRPVAPVGAPRPTASVAALAPAAAATSARPHVPARPAAAAAPAPITHAYAGAPVAAGTSSARLAAAPPAVAAAPRAASPQITAQRPSASAPVVPPPKPPAGPPPRASTSASATATAAASAAAVQASPSRPRGGTIHTAAA